MTTMLDELKVSAKRQKPNFIELRWNNPLHNQDATDKQGRLWPSSEEFYHPLNPIFSFFFTTPEHLSTYEVVLLRDGALGILDFFLRFPVPPKKVARFLICAEFMFLVPEAWRKHVLAYRMESPRPFIPTKKFIFYSLVSENCLSWGRFKPRIEKWLQNFPKDVEVSAYFVIRNNMFDHRWVDVQTPFELMSVFQSHFKLPINLLTYGDFKNAVTENDVTLVNLDLWRAGCGLCSVDNLAFSQNVTEWPRARYAGFTGKKIAHWPMSLKHNLDIYTPESTHNDASALIFQKKTSPHKLVTFPYPMLPSLMELLNERMTFKVF